jgi:RHS repeat-associated protein
MRLRPNRCHSLAPLFPLVLGLALTSTVFAAVSPNRTLPQMDPPRVGLQFSAPPTKAEILQARVFDEPLVPVGGEPLAVENSALATALLQHSQRSRADDFVRLTRFLDQHPKSAWRAALLTGLGLEYYQTAYYSRALAAWEEAWALGQKATDVQGKLLADRALCELAGLYTRLGRMTELEALLKSIEGRVLLGGAPERINLAREALALMQFQPEISFRCGPLALLSIQRMRDPETPGDVMPLINSASTHQGFSLAQVAELSQAVGLNYQMAFRNPLTPSLSPSDGERVSAGRVRSDFIVPSVVHWKVGHYAALVRQVGDLFLLEDPTFGNSVWATREALEAETSGYFLIPAGELPQGWRSVTAVEGETVWGKGVTSGIDPDNYTPEDEQGGICSEGNGVGMAVTGVHLGIVSLQVRDTPVGYQPPVGPDVRFTVRYNHRDYLQPPSLIYRKLGVRWTHDWEGFIVDNPLNGLADVKYFVTGGGARTFTGFNTNTQAFAPQQLEQSRLTRTGPNSYEMLFRNGSKRIFGLRSGARVFLTQVVDPAGNAVTLSWSGDRLVALTDAIGQVTTLSYEHPSAPGLITKVTDPFGRFATFEYGNFLLTLDPDNNTNTPPVVTNVYALTKITDVIGIASQFNFQIIPATNSTTDLSLISMTTPYGTTSFNKGQGGGPAGSTRFVETTYPDGSRDRVEYNQNTNGIAFSDPAAVVPQGMNVFNRYLHGRNTFYWSRNAYAQGAGDYSQAKIYHWLHSPNIATTAGILESIKEPLERRVWFTYPGQSDPYLTTGTSDRPTKVGRVLDDGSTQLYSYDYNSLGRLTNAVDPVGRKFSYLHAPNEIDLLEVRQTRGTNNELVFAFTYNAQHLPLTITDAAGQTTTNTYNSRGQLLTTTNPKGETLTFTYDPDGYLLTVDGPLPGNGDTLTFTYDAYGRPRTRTDMSGYTLTFDYDDMDRLTRATYPDATFDQYTYHRLDLVSVLDSAGRLTSFEYDNMRQLKKHTDPLNRATRFEWCACGSLNSLTDSLGRMTEWRLDVQGRPVSQQYSDGSKVTYLYEHSTSRLRQMLDEKNQITQFTFYRDNSLNSIAYANSAIPTPAVKYTYDQNYLRLATITDGSGTTRYAYHPITGGPNPGGGLLASIDGPLTNDTITFGYDVLGRRISTAINGVATALTYDAAGRSTGETNVLGSFAYAYANASRRLVSLTYPNSQVTELSYFNNLQDRELQRITHKLGVTPLSEFIYARNVPAGRITTWSQQAGVAPPNLNTFGYDAVNQLLSATITNGSTLVGNFAYGYDPAGNRLTEQASGSSRTATYNPLNQIITRTLPGIARTNEWDAQNRLVAVTAGTQRTELTYDSFSRLTSLRLLTNGVEASFRSFVWSDGEISEERDAAGTVTKRFFEQGVKLESGPNAGSYFYTRDHLGSIRELTDANGTVRARYTYDPYGRHTKLSGDLEADFGFAGMFWSAEANLNLTQYRAYDPELGRWLSRDPLRNAELIEGPNLYAYVANNPVNLTDPSGLSGDLIPWVAGELSGGGSGQGAGELAIRAAGELDLRDEMRAMDWIADALNSGRLNGADRFEFRRMLYNARQREMWESFLITDEQYRRRTPDVSKAPKTMPSRSFIGPLHAAGEFLGAGITILTMTDCNTVEGIFALVRQGKGGMANKHADRLYKQLKAEGL